MSLKSRVFTAPGFFFVPPTVSFVWANKLAGGGGGQAGVNGAGGSSGGSGEFSLGLPIPVTPGAVLAVNPGSVGTGGTAASGGVPPFVESLDGGTTSFGGFSMLGGGAVANSNSFNFSGTGGGPGGGARIGLAGTPGFAGAIESPTAYGGCSGGTGEGLSVSGGGAGGQQIGEYSAPSVPNTSFHPSGSGGNTVFGAGGLGTSSSANGANGGFGAGGSGASAVTGLAKTAGSGGGGIVHIFYFER